MSAPATPSSDTIVIQTFRRENIPAWMQRCLDSVRYWTALQGYDYDLAGDEFYELCGPEYLARGNKNPQAITNLARLIATRNRLDQGYKKVIWLDADVFVFAPRKLVLDFPAEELPTGYAVGREVWANILEGTRFRVTQPVAHNAATYFTPQAVDLDMLINLIRHIDAKRELVSNLQVGVQLLRGLQYSLMFPTFSHVALISPLMIRSLHQGTLPVLKLYGRAYRYHAYAVNLGLSLQHEVTEEVLWSVMDLLERTEGEALNQHALVHSAWLIPYDKV